MPHQCVRCSKIIPTGSREIVDGCSNCGSHFFFYIRDEQLAKIREAPLEIPEIQKIQIEKDIREIAGITNSDEPVILDIESVRVVGQGKFEIDLVNLFNKKRPIVYKLEEGKYLIDLASSFGQKIDDDHKIDL